MMVYADNENIYISFPKHMLGTLNSALVKGVSALKHSDEAPTQYTQVAELVLITFLDEILCAEHLTEESAHEFKLAFNEVNTTLKASSPKANKKATSPKARE